MGMYTELVMSAELIKDPPSSVTDILSLMVGDIDSAIEPQDGLFTTSRWQYLFQMDSYYFAGDTHSSFRYDATANCWFLTVRSNLKNYDNEIQLFLDWFAPYSETQGFVGYWHYEENENPTLIYIDKGSINTIEVTK